MTRRSPHEANVRLLHEDLDQNDPSRKKPQAPGHLDDEAKREWRRMATKLYDLGLLTEVDKAALAAYCVAWSRWIRAEEALQKYGMVVVSPEKGWPMQSPYLAIANRAMTQLLKLIIEFGMSPSSRSRVQVVEPVMEPDPMEEILRRS